MAFRRNHLLPHEKSANWHVVSFESPPFSGGGDKSAGTNALLHKIRWWSFRADLDTQIEGNACYWNFSPKQSPIRAKRGGGDSASGLANLATWKGQFSNKVASLGCDFVVSRPMHRLSAMTQS